MSGSQSGEDEPSDYLALDTDTHTHTTPPQNNINAQSHTHAHYSQLLRATDPGSCGVYSVFGYEKG